MRMRFKNIMKKKKFKDIKISKTENKKKTLFLLEKD